MRPTSLLLWCLAPFAPLASASAQTPVEQPQAESSESTDLNSLRSLIDQQTRQLNSLQDRILRLQEMVALLLARPGPPFPVPSTPSAQPAPSTSGPAINPAPNATGFRPATLSGQKEQPIEPVSSPSSTPGSEPTPAAQSAPSVQAIAPPQHLVEKGQTLTSIAKQHGTSVAELQKLNRIDDVRKLQVGQRLLLPSPEGTPPVSSSPSTQR